jgi:hypothetical protein
MSAPNTPKPRTLVMATAAVALSLAAAGLASSPASAQPTSGNSSSTRCVSESGKPGVKQIDTPHYRMILAVGSAENMYTQAQVDAQGITSGELMLAGKMNSPMNMGMGGGKKQHVEVSICNLKTGTVVTGAKVRMSMAPKGGPYMPMTVAEMRGLDEPITMSHYGNNVKVPKSPYTVKVKTAGETAVFRVKS